MIEDERPLFDQGHNRPPSQIDAAIADQRLALEFYQERRDEFVSAAKAAVIRDRDTAGQAADINRLAATVWRRIDEGRRERSTPFYDAQGTLKSIVDEFWQPVFDAMDDLGEKVRLWDADEKARIQKQRDEQDAEMRRLEQAVPADAVPQCNPAPTAQAREPRRRRIKGDYGGTVIDKATHQYAVTDVHAVPDFILNSAPVHAAIIGVVKSMAKVTEIPGIKVDSGSELTLR